MPLHALSRWSVRAAFSLSSIRRITPGSIGRCASSNPRVLKRFIRRRIWRHNFNSMTFDVYSMGFSNRTWDDTIAILRKFEIHRLVDIRTLPGSKHTPQFNQEHLERALPDAGIEYVHMKELGGLRKAAKNS